MFHKNQRVRFVRELDQWESHCRMAMEYIEKGKLYTVEHYFHGTPAQVELVGITDVLFVADLFDEVE